MTRNLDSFRYTGNGNDENNNKPHRITKIIPKAKAKRRTNSKLHSNNQKSSVDLPDLQPSLNDHLQVLFVDSTQVLNLQFNNIIMHIIRIYFGNYLIRVNYYIK